MTDSCFWDPVDRRAQMSIPCCQSPTGHAWPCKGISQRAVSCCPHVAAAPVITIRPECDGWLRKWCQAESLFNMNVLSISLESKMKEILLTMYVTQEKLWFKMWKTCLRKYQKTKIESLGKLGIHVILLIRKSHYFKEMLFLPAVDWMFVSPPQWKKFLCWSPNPPDDGIWKWFSGR